VNAAIAVDSGGGNFRVRPHAAEDWSQREKHDFQTFGLVKVASDTAGAGFYAPAKGSKQTDQPDQPDDCPLI